MARANRPASGLTPKQRRFCQQYIIDLNGTKAAIRAGYSTKGARVQASCLLSNPNIAAEIAKSMEKRSDRTEITVDRVLKEYARLAFLDIRKAFDGEGSLKPIQSLDDDTAAAIAGIESEDIFGGPTGDRRRVGTIRKIKLSDKKGALDSLARHLGMFVDRAETTVNAPGTEPRLKLGIPDDDDRHDDVPDGPEVDPG